MYYCGNKECRAIYSVQMIGIEQRHVSPLELGGDMLVRPV